MKDKKYFEANMTLETALTLPIFLFAILSIISVMDMIRFHASLEFELSSVAKETSTYSVAIDGLSETNSVAEIPKDLLTTAYVKNKVLKNYSDDDMKQAGVVGGKKGISDLFSLIQSQDNMMDYIYTYRMTPNFSDFGYKGMFVINRCRMRVWNGYEITPENTSGERYVYITENGTVYHLTTTCSYLDLSIIPAKQCEIENIRNVNGAKYQECKTCSRRKDQHGEQVFITMQGDCYHYSLECGGLKRTIYKVPLSEVGDKSACSRCG